MTTPAIFVGPAATAVANNTNLPAGALGVTNEGGIKVGPGAWNALPYLASATDVAGRLARPANLDSAPAGVPLSIQKDAITGALTAVSSPAGTGSGTAGGAVPITASTEIDLTRAGPAYSFMALRHTGVGEVATIKPNPVEDGGCKFALYGLAAPDHSAFINDNGYSYDSDKINIYFAYWSYGQAHIAGVAGAAVDTIAPLITAASVANATKGVVHVTVSEAVANLYNAAQFGVSGKTVTGITRVDATHFDLAITPAAAYGEVLTLSATQTSTNDLRDLATPTPNLLANIAGVSINTSAIAQPPQFTAANPFPIGGIVGEPVSYQVAATGADSYAKVSGPAGLAVSSTGLVTGALTGVGTTPLVVSATGSTGTSTVSMPCRAVAADAGRWDRFQRADGAVGTPDDGGSAYTAGTGTFFNELPHIESKKARGQVYHSIAALLPAGFGSYQIRLTDFAATGCFQGFLVLTDGGQNSLMVGVGTMAYQEQYGAGWNMFDVQGNNIPSRSTAPFSGTVPAPAAGDILTLDLLPLDTSSGSTAPNVILRDKNGVAMVSGRFADLSGGKGGFFLQKNDNPNPGIDMFRFVPA